MREGTLFFTRGIRLLGTDLQSAGRLFARAGAGASLKPREVCPPLQSGLQVEFVRFYLIRCWLGIDTCVLAVPKKDVLVHHIRFCWLGMNFHRSLHQAATAASFCLAMMHVYEAEGSQRLCCLPTLPRLALAQTWGSAGLPIGLSKQNVHIYLQAGTEQQCLLCPKLTPNPRRCTRR